MGNPDGSPVDHPWGVLDLRVPEEGGDDGSGVHHNGAAPLVGSAADHRTGHGLTAAALHLALEEALPPLQNGASPYSLMLKETQRP